MSASSELPARLSGLTSLTGLSFCNYNFVDLPLLVEELPDSISYLGLQNSRITSTTPFNKLKQLRHLDLHNNQVSSVELSDLPELDELHIGDNTVTEFRIKGLLS